jgi:hypothetical protein
VVQLEDRAVASDEDPRRPAMRSSSAATKPDGARGFAWDCCGLRKGKSERQARVLGGADGVSLAWTRRRRHGDSGPRSDRPGQNGRAFKGARRCCVRSAHGVNVPLALRQVGPVSASAPLTGGPSV